MPIYSPTGFLDITNATLRTSNTECQNLKIGTGNLYVTSEISPSFELNLSNVTSLGATSPHTLTLSNVTTAIDATSNIITSGNLKIGGLIYTKDWGIRTASGSNDLYVGRFTVHGITEVLITDQGASLGSASKFTITRNVSSTPLVNGIDSSSTINYEWYFESHNSTTYDLWVRPTAAVQTNIKVTSSTYIPVDAPTSPTLIPCANGLINMSGNVVASQNLTVSGNVYVSSNLTVSGNVGIGTSSPQEKFHLYGAPMIQHDTVYQEVSGNNVWYKLGVWNTSGQGANLKLTLLGGSGYNTIDNNKGGETIIYAKILNNLNTTVANIGGMFHSVGNPTVYQVKFKQVSSNRYQYEVHAEVPSYTLHNMSIECSLTTSFTRYFAASGDPGVDSSTVRAAKLTHAINESGNLTVSGKVTRTYNPGEIIEELNTVCNGRPVTVQSGTYTPTNVTASQTSSATYTEINGSRVTYNKPVGATRIYYKFACQWEDANNGALTNFKIRVYHNGAWRDINLSRYLHSAQYVNDGNNHGSAWVINEFVFECDADTESQHDGRFLSSKTSYTFQVVWRQHGSGTGYQSKLHLNDWWDGSGTNILHPPQLTIRSIA